jgi:hypothetical protein
MDETAVMQVVPVKHPGSRRMEGGPLHGHLLYLRTPSTLTFTIRGETGYYNERNNWVRKSGFAIQ